MEIIPHWLKVVDVEKIGISLQSSHIDTNNPYSQSQHMKQRRKHTSSIRETTKKIGSMDALVFGTYQKPQQHLSNVILSTIENCKNTNCLIVFVNNVPINGVIQCQLP